MARLEDNLDRAAAKPWTVRPAAARRVRLLCLCSAHPSLHPSTAPPRRSLHYARTLCVCGRGISVSVSVCHNAVLCTYTRLRILAIVQRAALTIVQRVGRAGIGVLIFWASRGVLQYTSIRFSAT